MREKTKLKKMLAFLLCTAMLIAYMPSAAISFADENADEPVVVQEDPTPAPAVDNTVDAPADEPVVSGDSDRDPANIQEPVEEDVDDMDPGDNPEDADVIDAETPEDPEVVPEVTEEEPEAETNEYPAVTLSKTVNGVVITLSAPEGSLPEGVQLSVSSVSSQAVYDAVEETLEGKGKTIADAVAFDVTPLDKNGNPVQPRIPVSVTFSGTGLENGGGGVDVFRVSDSASSVTEMSTSVATTNKQTFTTGHFTIYVVASSASDPQGDGQSAGNRYVLEYGESVTLESDITRVLSSNWSINPRNGVNLRGQTVTNNNQTDQEINVTVEHECLHYVGFNIFPTRTIERFYITAMPRKVTITFMLQDAGESDFAQYGDTLAVNYGSDVDLEAEGYSMPDSKEEGGKTYKFYGWSSDTGCETDAVFTSVQNDMTVYGKYTTEAKIVYKKNSGSDAATIPDEQTAGAGNTVKIGSASRDGYAFTGWNTKADGSGDSYSAGRSIAMPEDGLTLYAQWSEDNLELQFMYNYAGAPNNGIFDSDSVAKNSRVTISSEIPTRPPLGPINYMFRGWATSANGSPQYFPGETYTTGSGDRENKERLYAIWANISFNDLDTLTANSDEVTYDGQEHSISGVTGGTPWAQDPDYVKVGDTRVFGFDIYAYIGDIEASGTDAGSYSTPISAPLYYIVGFVMVRIDIPGIRFPYMEIEGGTLTINPAEVTVDTDSDEKAYDGEELTAGGKVTLADGSESTFTHEGDAVTLVNGETLNIRTIGSQTDPGQSDNTFEVDWGKPDDWGSSASTAKKYNYKVTVGELGKLTVYYGVKFDKNTDDDVTGMPDDIKAYEVDEDGNITAEIPADVPSREHYKFLGWAKDAGATAADYQPGDTVAITSSDVGEDGAMTLYAVWEAKMFKVTFKNDDGSVISEKEYQEGTAAADVEKPANPTKAADGNNTYTFAGWDKEVAEVTEDAVYTATYTATPIPTPAPDDEDDDADDDAADGAAAAAAVVAGDDGDGGDDIADGDVPMADTPETNIDDNETPLSQIWSVGNLVMAAITALGAIFALFRKKEDEDDEDDSADKKMLAAKIAGALAGLAAPITFFLTENMTNVAVAFDKWTPLMAGILAVQVVSAVLNKTASKASDAVEEAAE